MYLDCSIFGSLHCVMVPLVGPAVWKKQGGVSDKGAELARGLQSLWQRAYAARTGRCKGKAVLLEDFAPEQAVTPAHARSSIQPLLDLRLLNRDPEGKEATRRVLHCVSRGSLGRTNGVYV